jgi:hypothetical protein
MASTSATPAIVDAEPRPALEALRRFLRWSLLLGCAVGMATWCACHARADVQLVTLVTGCMAWVAVGCLGLCVEVIAAVAARIACDAWFWCALHRHDLARRLQPPSAVAGDTGWHDAGGIPALRLAGDVVLFRIGDGWEVRGVAHDSVGRLTLGGWVPGEGALVRVVDLGRGWRAWSTGD